MTTGRMMMHGRQPSDGPRHISRRGALGMMAATAGAALLAACGGSATATPITATATTAAGAAPTQTTAAAPAVGGSGATATRPAATTSAASTASTAVTGSAAAATAPAGGAAATIQKVNANTASQAELLAAFQANGIPSAAQWVREVMEYRPYPTNDPSFAKLRTELAKYNPSPAVVDQIVASLSL